MIAVSGVGKVSQLVFAFVAPGNVVSNILAGGIAEAGAQQAGDLMQDLKVRLLPPSDLFFGRYSSFFSQIVVDSACSVCFILLHSL